MKIIEAINRIDALKHNTYTQSDKVRWLSTLDSMVKNHVIDTHEGAEDVVFTGYDDSTDVNKTELLVPAPYDEMYLQWLESKIDYHNGEYGRYNNTVERFNTIYEGFKKHYNRTHMPRSKKLNYYGSKVVDSASSGSQCKPCKDGCTPVKGKDYWTDADKKEIIDTLLNSIPEAEGGSY